MISTRQKNAVAIGAGVVGAIAGGAGLGMLVHSVLEWRNAAVGTSGFWSAIMPILPPARVLLETALAGVMGALSVGGLSACAAESAMNRMSRKLTSLRSAKTATTSMPPRGPSAAG